MSETLKVAYWNMLDSIPPQDEGHLLDYYHALHKVYRPDVLFLTECRGTIVNELAPQQYAVDFEPSIFLKNKPNDTDVTPKDDGPRRGAAEGLAVVSRADLHTTISREQSWTGAPLDNGSRFDERQLVRVQVPFGGAQIALYASHIFHPHHLHHPSYNTTRIRQWRLLRERLAAEELPFAWFADTNTTLASTVQDRLKRAETGAVLLDHTGNIPQQTWTRINFFTRLLGVRLTDLLYLDRAAVSEDLLSHAKLQTLPVKIGRAVNPSDHRPIMMTITAPAQK